MKQNEAEVCFCPLMEIIASGYGTANYFELPFILSRDNQNNIA